MILQLPPRRSPDAAVPVLVAFIAVIALMLFLASGSFGQYPGGICPSPYDPFVLGRYPLQTATPVAVERVEWTPLQADGCYYLYRGSRQIGGYRASTGEMMHYVGDRWIGAPAVTIKAKSPTACPCGEQCKCGLDPCLCVTGKPGVGDPLNFGIDLGEMERHKRLAYRLNGHEVSREAAVDALTLTDDTAGRIGYVVAVGNDQVAKDWTEAATLAPFREVFAFQSYKTDDVMPAKLGYSAPGVYVVAKDQSKGPLAYQGPEQLGGILDGIKNPKTPLMDVNIPSWVWVTAIIVTILNIQAILTQLLQFLNDPTNAAAVATVLSLLLSSLHIRGSLPVFLTTILNKILGQPTPAPATPGTPTAHPVLDAVLSKLQERLGGATPVGFSVVPVAGADANTLAITLHTAEVSAK